jgi:hypothetical protein
MTDGEVLYFQSPQKAEWVKNALSVIQELEFPSIVKYFSVKVSGTTVEIEREHFEKESLSIYLYELSLAKIFLSEKVFFFLNS